MTPVKPSATALRTGYPDEPGPSCDPSTNRHPRPSSRTPVTHRHPPPGFGDSAVHIDDAANDRRQLRNHTPGTFRGRISRDFRARAARSGRRIGEYRVGGSRMPLPKPAAGWRDHWPPAMLTVHVRTRALGVRVGRAPSELHAARARCLPRPGCEPAGEPGPAERCCGCAIDCISITRTLQQTPFSPTAFPAIVDALGYLGATIGSSLRP